MLDITTTLEQNNGADRLSIPFIAHVECNQLVNRGPHFQIPVRASYTGMKKTYSVEVSGFRLTTEHVNNVPTLIERLMEGVTRLGRIPHYVFIARDAGVVYPVYTIDDEVLAPTPYGPLFQHIELAVVRKRLGDYLHDIKVLGAKGRTDKFHVRGVDRHTLQLVRPIFYLKKRDVTKEDDFWAPVFRSKEGGHIYAYAASDRREAVIDSGKEVLVLHNLVANVLKDDGRLTNKFDLRPDRLFAEMWEQLKATLIDNGDELTVSGVSIPIYTAADGVTIGLEARLDEERYSLFLGGDIDGVREQAAADFARRGIGV